MLPEETRADSFTGFVTDREARLRHALTAAFGPERGREATAEALAYGWENWNRVREMENPAGFLYRVGRDRARRYPRAARVSGLEAVAARVPWVEPRLSTELHRLPERQRVVFTLLHGYEWTYGEVAELLGVSKGTVQTHERRAMNRLRRGLGVDNDK